MARKRDRFVPKDSKPNPNNDTTPIVYGQLNHVRDVRYYLPPADLKSLYWRNDRKLSDSFVNLLKKADSFKGGTFRVSEYSLVTDGRDREIIEELEESSGVEKKIFSVSSLETVLAQLYHECLIDPNLDESFGSVWRTKIFYAFVYEGEEPVPIYALSGYYHHLQGWIFDAQLVDVRKKRVKDEEEILLERLLLGESGSSQKVVYNNSRWRKGNRFFFAHLLP